MMRIELERELAARPVRALQYMLNRLALVCPFLPLVHETGIFDEETLEAVMRFQRELSPPVTGMVDRPTWQAILEQYDRAQELLDPPRPVRAFPGNGKQSKPGEWQGFLALPQIMFQSLSHYFHDIRPGDTTGLHDRAAEENLRWLQRRSGLPVTGELDQATWNALSRLYEVFVVPDGVLGEEDFPAWG